MGFNEAAASCGGKLSLVSIGFEIHPASMRPPQAAAENSAAVHNCPTLNGLASMRPPQAAAENAEPYSA